MKTTTKCRAVPYEPFELELLKNPEDANMAIEVAIEEFEKDDDLSALLNTLRLVAKAQGGLASLARKISVSRQTLNEALSAKGNPRIRTFQNLLRGLGIKMTFRQMSKMEQAKAA